MRFSILILTLFAMALPKDIRAQSLNDYQWKNRILLLVDPGPDTDVLKAQLDELKSDQEALEERDLIIFRVTPDAVYRSDASPSKLRAKKIYEDFDLDSDFSGTVLIGKDGGAKLEEPFEVSARQVFDLIDGMPMRRAEIRKNKKN
jgi:peroxiredoxin